MSSHDPSIVSPQHGTATTRINSIGHRSRSTKITDRHINSLAIVYVR